MIDLRALILLRLWRYINHVLTYLLTYWRMHTFRQCGVVANLLSITVGNGFTKVSK